MTGTFSCTATPGVYGVSPNVCVVSFVADDVFKTLPQQLELRFSLPLTRAQVISMNISSLHFRGTMHGLQLSLLAPNGTIFAGESDSVFHIGLQPWRFLVDPVSTMSATGANALQTGYLPNQARFPTLGSTLNASTYWSMAAASGVAVRIQVGRSYGY